MAWDYSQTATPQGFDIDSLRLLSVELHSSLPQRPFLVKRTRKNRQDGEHHREDQRVGKLRRVLSCDALTPPGLRMR